MGLTAIAAVVLLALAVTGSGLATSSTFADVPYTSIAGTDLHASQVGSSSETFTSECSQSELGQLDPGEVLWHFVLVQTTALNTGSLRAEFDSAGVTSPDVTYTKFVGGVVHWDVITPSSDTLLNASTDAVGAILNLSHVCGGGGSGGQTSSISTTVHLGQSDIGTPTVVDNANPAPLGSYVHDSADLTFTGGGTLPTGSTVYFSYFTNNDCTTPPADTANVDVGGESSPATGLDPALVKGPLGAGSYSYIAVFISGNSSVVGDSIGDCEPFKVNKADLQIGTDIHNAAHQVITSADAGAVVHDTATLSSLVTGFNPDLTKISFTFFANGTCDGIGAAVANTGSESTYVARSADSAPLAAGDYSYRASFAGDGNYNPAGPSACEPLHIFRAALTIGYWKTHMHVCAAREKQTTSGCSSNGPFTVTYLGTKICQPNCVTVGVLGTYDATTESKALAVFNANNCSNASATDANAAACLAAQLLGAQLNVANGANTCICTTINQAMAALTAVLYKGPGQPITLSGSGYTRANLITLKTKLDTYNNGGGCP